MRILHSADWHLGKRNGSRVDRSGDLRRNVEAIFGYCESEAVDLLLIAGDLFDDVCRQEDVCAAIDHLKGAAGPFLRRGGTILVVTGNHDREIFCTTLHHTLGLADPVAIPVGGRLAPGRLHLITRPALHRLADGDGPDVQFVLMPYPTTARYLDDAITPYSGGGEGKYRRLRELFSDTLARIRRHDRFDDRLHSVLVAHLFLQGATLPNGCTITADFEKDDVVCPGEDLGAGWAYVALGDVHKPQAVGGRPSVRYSGSIERMDLGEREDEKGVVIVEVGAGGLRGEPRWLPLEASTFLDLAIADPAVELAELEARYPAPTEALVRCAVTYRPGVDDPDEIDRRLRAMFPRCYSSTITPAGRDRADGDVAPWEGAAGRSPRETVIAYVKERLKDDDPMAADVLAEVESLFEEVGP